VRGWVASVDSTSLYISVLVVGEIRQGIERLGRRDPRRALAFESWLGTLVERYGSRIIPITTSATEEWGRLGTIRTIPAVDALMSATAKVHALTLVTRNVTAFDRTGISVLDPFAFVA
jgi:predicted nucleic acid-binding protein